MFFSRIVTVLFNQLNIKKIKSKKLISEKIIKKQNNEKPCGETL
jgi:hypothetical protein